MESNERYGVTCIVDNKEPVIKAAIEKTAREELLQVLERAIFSGARIAIKVTREEYPYSERDEEYAERCTVAHYIGTDLQRVIYRADLAAVKEMPLLVDIKPYRKSTGRNHRKKDRARARKIRKNGENGLHTGNAKENREGDKAGSTAPGTEDNTGLHGSRTDNTAGNKYGN